jgi:hypothetical protein
MQQFLSLSLCRVLISAATILTASMAFAGEQVLEFKLVTYRGRTEGSRSPKYRGSSDYCQ